MSIISGGRVAAMFLTWSSSALSKSSILSPLHFRGEISAGLRSSSAFTSSYSCIARISSSSKSNVSVKKKKKEKEKEFKRSPVAAESLVKRTRSVKELDDDLVEQHLSVDSHIPVMLGEVLDVFSSLPDRRLYSFVDCTVGGGGHSSAVIQAHPELQYYVGLDVDPVAYQLAQNRINALLTGDTCTSSNLSSHIILKNFRFIKSVLGEVDGKLIDPGVDGILMDLGMSSMQVNSPERGFSVLENGPLDMRMDPKDSLTAEHILNSWPGDEVGRILREYGEEHNWFSLQNKIVKSRSTGGFHSTGDLVHLIRCSTPKVKGGRQGWIKTATRVFQALRIAVNDELNTLKDSLYASFDCLAPGGRLAVISFHSLEDRIVKQTFLDIIGSTARSNNAGVDMGIDEVDDSEAWIRRVILGEKGRILTKRPITPSEKEEKLNRRSRSAKLRVIEKMKL